MSDPDPPVVLLGGGVNTVSAARSYGRRGRQVVVLSEGGPAAAVRASRHVRSCIPVPTDAPVQEHWAAVLATLPPSVLVPCGDVGVELLATRRAELEALGHHPVEGDGEFLLAALDKQRTYELADLAGVERPATRVVSTVGAALQAGAELGFPLGVKPRFSHRFATLGTGRKAYVVHDRSQLQACLAPLVEQGVQMLLTEIVPGPDDAFSSYYGYIDDAGRELLHYTKRKLRQYPVHFGTGTYHRAEHVPEALRLGRQFFLAAGLRGLGNVEFKRDARDGRLRLIECNARLTAAADLVRRSGLDLAEVVYQRALGREVDVGPIHYGLSQWLPLQDLRALRGYRREGSLDTATWSRSLLRRQSLPLLDWSDPGPSLAHAGLLATRALHRRREAAGRAVTAA